MKKILLFTLLIATTVVFGQDNTIKLKLSPFLLNTGYLEFERAVADNASLTLGIGRTFPTNLQFDGFVDQDDEEAAVFGDPKLSGFNATLEFRAYTNGQGDQQGFYVAPFLRHSSYKIAQGAYIEDNNSTDRISAEASVKLSNTIGMGVGIGSQWIINDKISIDVTWIGLGFSRSKIIVEYKSDDDGVDFRDYQEEIEEEFVGESRVNNIETTENSAKVTTTGFLLPIIRGSFAIGYRF